MNNIHPLLKWNEYIITLFRKTDIFIFDGQNPVTYVT